MSRAAAKRAITQALECGKVAIELDNKGSFEASLDKYIEASEYLITAIQHSQSKDQKSMRVTLGVFSVLLVN
jgi:hypothetical protein